LYWRHAFSKSTVKQKEKKGSFIEKMVMPESGGTRGQAEPFQGKEMGGKENFRLDDLRKSQIFPWWWGAKKGIESIGKRTKRGKNEEKSKKICKKNS